MTHHRTRIRKAVAAVLAPIGTVSVNRDDPLQAGELPCLAVFTPDESTQEITMGTRRQLRRMDLVVDGYVQAGAGLDDQLDAMAVQIETAIAAGKRFGNLISAIELIRTVTDKLTFGEVRAGVVRLTFAVTYQTNFGAPDA